MSFSIHSKVNLPEEAKKFINEKVQSLQSVANNITDVTVTLREVKSNIECQIKIVLAHAKPLVVKSSGFSIKSAFTEAYDKSQLLLYKIKEKNVDKKHKQF